MPAASKKSEVYFLPWESRERFPELLAKSGAAGAIREDDLVALKIHFGERGGDGYIRPEYARKVADFLKDLKASPFLTDTGTIYHGERSNAVGHLKVATDHGFTQEATGAPVIIADGIRGDDCEEVPVSGKHYEKVHIATGILRADSIFALSHFKGHLIAGFGGAIKNLGMGCGSRKGKFAMHSGVSPTIDRDACVGCGECVARCAHGAMSLDDGRAELDAAKCVGCGECVLVCDYGALGLNWSRDTAAVQERFAEYAAGAVKGRRAFYVNFLNHITPNCDCLGEVEEPLIPDIGILASSDPVAIDQACLDLVRERGGDLLEKAHPGIDCTVQLSHAEKTGLGSRDYELLSI